MLETEMKLLREAIEANTKALLSQQPQTFEPTETVEEKPKTKAKTKVKTKAVKKEKVKEDVETSEKITSQTVLDLAKTKMGEGVPRATIKAIITNLGAESIADLDDDGLSSLYSKLEEL